MPFTFQIHSFPFLFLNFNSAEGRAQEQDKTDTTKYLQLCPTSLSYSTSSNKQQTCYIHIEKGLGGVGKQRRTQRSGETFSRVCFKCPSLSSLLYALALARPLLLTNYQTTVTKTTHNFHTLFLFCFLWAGTLRTVL